MILLIQQVRSESLSLLIRLLCGVRRRICPFSELKPLFPLLLTEYADLRGGKVAHIENGVLLGKVDSLRVMVELLLVKVRGLIGYELEFIVGWGGIDGFFGLVSFGLDACEAVVRGLGDVDSWRMGDSLLGSGFYEGAEICGHHSCG
jgi:hypothetical protein